MNKIIHDVVQNTPEWHALRIGKVTASRMKDVLTKGKGDKPSLTRQGYMYELLAERLTGQQANSFFSEAMAWGTEHEKNARALYELKNDVNVRCIGFISADDEIGGSPDGLVGKDGCIEIKCPNTSTHIKYLLTEEIPSDYYAQIQSNIWLSDTNWCDFISYDPRIKNEAIYFCKRIFRDDDYIKNIISESDRFLCDLKDEMEKINAKTK